MKHSIPFTELVQPNGRVGDIKIPCSEEIAKMGRAIIASGFWFACETLSMGHIRLEICGFRHLGDGVFGREGRDIEIAHSISTRGDALETLARRFYARL